MGPFADIAGVGEQLQPVQRGPGQAQVVRVLGYPVRRCAGVGFRIQRSAAAGQYQRVGQEVGQAELHAPGSLLGDENHIVRVDGIRVVFDQVVLDDVEPGERPVQAVIEQALLDADLDLLAGDEIGLAVAGPGLHDAVAWVGRAGGVLAVKRGVFV